MSMNFFFCDQQLIALAAIVLSRRSSEKRIWKNSFEFIEDDIAADFANDIVVNEIDNFEREVCVVYKKIVPAKAANKISVFNFIVSDELEEIMTRSFGKSEKKS